MKPKPVPTYQILLTAEHASNTVPSECGDLLTDFIAKCETHQIFDPGAKAITEELAQRLKCPAILGTCTRLAVDLNRSIGNSDQFSPPIMESDEILKERLLQKYYIPFRTEAKQRVEELLEQADFVIHISVHSFTKTFKGVRRDVDLGVLFDDKRVGETDLSRTWIKALQVLFPHLTIKANEPYHGREDGHTTALRRRFPENRYLGIELEFSQDLDLDLDAESYAKILATTLIKLLT